MSSTNSNIVIPRAAVSVVVRCNNGSDSKEPCYVLVQRGHEPNMGMWSLPGGKINAGESTLAAAQRELQEETQLSDELKWHNGGPFRSSDSIHHHDDGSVLFHYVISQCFCVSTTNAPPALGSSDDAADAQWWSLQQVQEKAKEGIVTAGVASVIEQAELLYTKGFLPCTTK